MSPAAKSALVLDYQTTKHDLIYVLWKLFQPIITLSSAYIYTKSEVTYERTSGLRHTLTRLQGHVYRQATTMK